MRRTAAEAGEDMLCAILARSSVWAPVLPSPLPFSSAYSVFPLCE